MKEKIRDYWLTTNTDQDSINLEKLRNGPNPPEYIRVHSLGGKILLFRRTNTPNFPHAAHPTNNQPPLVASDLID